MTPREQLLADLRATREVVARGCSLDQLCAVARVVVPGYGEDRTERRNALADALDTTQALAVVDATIARIEAENG